MLWKLKKQSFNKFVLIASIWSQNCKACPYNAIFLELKSQNRLKCNIAHLITWHILPPDGTPHKAMSASDCSDRFKNSFSISQLNISWAARHLGVRSNINNCPLLLLRFHRENDACSLPFTALLVCCLNVS